MFQILEGTAEEEGVQPGHLAREEVEGLPKHFRFAGSRGTSAKEATNAPIINRLHPNRLHWSRNKKVIEDFSLWLLSIG